MFVVLIIMRICLFDIMYVNIIRVILALLSCVDYYHCYIYYGAGVCMISIDMVNLTSCVCVCVCSCVCVLCSQSEVMLLCDSCERWFHKGV